MKIVYIKHAQKDNLGEENQKPGFKNQENRLTAFGIKEAEMVANALKEEVDFSAIYIGEFCRYKLTADIVNFGNAPVIVDKRLNESGSDDEFAGVVIDNENKKAIYARQAEVLNNRTHEFLNEIIQKHDNDDCVLCVSSGVNLGAFMSFFFSGEKIKMFEVVYATNLSPIVFELDKNNR